MSENATATKEAKAERGLLLPCPCCGEGEATVTLNLADGETLTCLECDTEFTAGDVRDLIARWAPVLDWIDRMPAGGEGVGRG